MKVKKIMISNDPMVHQKAATFVSYLIGSGLLIGDVMDFLNDNAAGIGVMIGTATFLINWLYQHKRFKQDKTAKEEVNK